MVEPGRPTQAEKATRELCRKALGRVILEEGLQEARVAEYGWAQGMR